MDRKRLNLNICIFVFNKNLFIMAEEQIIRALIQEKIPSEKDVSVIFILKTFNFEILKYNI